MNFAVSCSIVIYNHHDDMIDKVITELKHADIFSDIYIIDNSPINRFDAAYFKSNKVQYIFNNANLGYGKAHNIALRKALDTSTYHIILNPDIEVTLKAVLTCVDYMNQQKNVGLLMPKVLYPNGETQYL